MKPDKPEDREESWLRKMSEKLTRRRKSGHEKMQEMDEDEPEEEVEEKTSTSGSSRKAKKKRKKDDGCTWPVIVIFSLAVFGAWKLISALFG